MSKHTVTSQRNAVVTGAGRGLGLEFAKQLLARGYRVVGTARDPSKYPAMSELEGLETLALDVADPDSIAAAAQALGEKFEALHLVVNNAGINSMSNHPYSKASSLSFGELEQASLLNQLKVNAVGPVLLVQALSEMLIGTPGAKVLNISSWLGSISIKTGGGNYGYCTSKAALNMMNKAMAHDLAAKDVACFNFNPGWVQTDMGGSKAKLTAEESVGGMLATLDGLSVDDSGKFYNWDGSEHPW